MCPSGEAQFTILIAPYLLASYITTVPNDYSETTVKSTLSFREMPKVSHTLPFSADVEPLTFSQFSVMDDDHNPLCYGESVMHTIKPAVANSKFLFLCDKNGNIIGIIPATAA